MFSKPKSKLMLEVDEPDKSLQEVVVEAPEKKHITQHMMIDKLCKCRGTIKGIRHPWGMTINRKGELIVAEFNVHRISIFSQEGERLCTFGSRGSEGSSIVLVVLLWM